MATCAAANVKLVVTGEGPASVMTLKAIVTGSCSVFEDLNVRNLPRIWRSCDNVMTFRTSDAVMIAVPEDSFEIVF